MSARRSPEWFERWFDDTYAELYSHRNMDQAHRQVESLLRRVPARSRAPILDLGCGAGRHLAALRARGFCAFGLDLSLPLLRRARAAGLPVVRADLRHLPFRPGGVHGVVSFFSSFGYFRTPAEDARVLQTMGGLLRPGGWLFLDLANPAQVKANLVARDEKRIGARKLVQERSLRGGVVCKTITITDGGSREIYVERLRLYDLPRIRPVCRSAGLRLDKTFGDEECGPFDPHVSPPYGLVADQV